MNRGRSLLSAKGPFNKGSRSCFAAAVTPFPVKLFRRFRTRPTMNFASRCFEKRNSRGLSSSCGGYDGAFHNELALNLADTGMLRFFDPESEKWSETGLRIEPKQWMEVSLLANRRSGEFRLSVKKDDKNEEISSVVARLQVQMNLRNVVFIPQPPEANTVLIDDISLTEVR